MHPKDASRIANSVDPDQTAPLTWVCTVCPDLSVRKLRNIMVSVQKLRIFTVHVVLSPCRRRRCMYRYCYNVTCAFISSKINTMAKPAANYYWVLVKFVLAVQYVIYYKFVCNYFSDVMSLFISLSLNILLTNKVLCTFLFLFLSLTFQI